MAYASALAKSALLGAALLWFGARALSAAGFYTPAPTLISGEAGRAGAVVDGDTFFMKDGLKVRLAGIQAPKLSLGRDYVTDWPQGTQAKAALDGLLSGQMVKLYYAGLKRDRYERALAQVFVQIRDGQEDEEPVWVQEYMVRQGLARVYTWPDTQQDSQRLYEAEREARALERGIWQAGLADDFYAIRRPDPDPLAQYVDSFQIVEGVVTSAANIRGTTYLNFGANYKTDFTVVIDKDTAKKFEDRALDPMSLEGARVRVRGWIELYNGPNIQLGDADRLEVLN